jgi:hypothetical protein
MRFQCEYYKSQSLYELGRRHEAFDLLDMTIKVFEEASKEVDLREARDVIEQIREARKFLKPRWF